MITVAQKTERDRWNYVLLGPYATYEVVKNYLKVDRDRLKMYAISSKATTQNLRV